jgi:hypothetical protein
MRGWRKELLGHKSCIDAREALWDALRVVGARMTCVASPQADVRASAGEAGAMRVRGQRADSAMDEKPG